MQRISKFAPVREDEVLYTKGREFSLDGKNYIGVYHYKGTVPFTGDLNNQTKKQLTKYYESEEAYRYDRSFNFQKIESTYVLPKQSRIRPNQFDYEAGFLARYFIQDVINLDTLPIEIDSAQASDFGRPGGIDPGKFDLVEINWKLTGPLRSRLVNGIVQTGIFEYNQNQIKQSKYALLVYSVRSFEEFANVTIF